MVVTLGQDRFIPAVKIALAFASTIPLVIWEPIASLGVIYIAYFHYRAPIEEKTLRKA